MVRSASGIFTALVLAASQTLYAQQADRIRVVGFLSSATEPSRRHEAFREDLRKLGWVEGQNLKIEFRFAGSRPDRLAAAAEELAVLS